MCTSMFNGVDCCFSRCTFIIFCCPSTIKYTFPFSTSIIQLWGNGFPGSNTKLGLSVPPSLCQSERQTDRQSVSQSVSQPVRSPVHQSIRQLVRPSVNWSVPSHLPLSPLIVFMAMTVVGAMPPKLKLQSFIFHELEFVCFSKSTRMPVFTMAMSSSRRRACLKANTYSCWRK